MQGRELQWKERHVRYRHFAPLFVKSTKTSGKLAMELEDQIQRYLLVLIISIRRSPYSPGGHLNCVGWNTPENAVRHWVTGKVR